MQLDALEYIHSKGYAHADIKGPNILLSYGDGIGKEKSQAYLVDYGLAYRFRTGTGEHKPFVHDERRAHEGTLEFTSRDAHHGSMPHYFQWIFSHVINDLYSNLAIKNIIFKKLTRKIKLFNISKKILHCEN